MLERLVGMQAQVPSNPYVALWARLRDFDPAELSDLVAGRDAVRAQLMRSTIHLVSARDALALHPLTAPVLARTFAGQAQFLKAMVAAGVELEPVVAAGRELLAEAPRTRAELAAALGPRWPQVAPATLAQAVTFSCRARPGAAARAVGRERRGALGPDRGVARRRAGRRAVARRRRAPLPRRLRPRDRRPTSAPGRASPACDR